MEIRRCRRDDLPALVQLLRGSWLSALAPLMPYVCVRHGVLADHAGQYARERWREFDVAVEDGEVVGMLHVMGDLVAAVHVRFDRRGRGVGSRLLDLAEARVAAVGKARIRLEVMVRNEGAQRLYRRRGYDLVRRFDDREGPAPIPMLELAKRFG